MDSVEQAITWSAVQRLDSDDDEIVERPFEAVPGLEDCPLAGLRSALSWPSEALWTQSRRWTELRGVCTTRIDAIYNAPDVSTTVFKELDPPSTLPLTQVQWQADNTLKQQQSMLGRTACALLKGLHLMEPPLEELARIAETLPDDARARILEQVDSLQNETLAPVGHTMRCLAQGYNDLSFRSSRRNLQPHSATAD